MTLTGVDPNDPTPSIRRELIFGAGPGSSGIERDVVLYGNKTAAGSETVNTLGAPIADDQDARDRFGERSELYQMYKWFVDVDKSATIYGIAVTDPAGTAGDVDLDVTGVSDANSTITVTICGVDVTYQVSNGDAVATTTAGLTAAINAAEEGTLPVLATDGTTKVTITCANTGVRGDFIIGTTAIQGVRVKIVTKGGTNTQTITKTLVSITPGAGEDDGTSAFALTSPMDNIYWHVAPWHTVTAAGSDTRGSATDVATTDNQTGELIDMIRTQNLPINSKEKQAVFGLVASNADAILVPKDADVNTVRASFFWQQNNDWTPAMIAAHHCAIMRSGYIAHPSRNRAGYTQSDNTPYHVPPPYTPNDVPTATEIRTALNNGVSVITFGNGNRPILLRAITSRNFNDGGAKDYKAREHHITYAIDFVWSEIKARWEAQKQEFVAGDPQDGALPTLNTSTPSQLRGIIFNVINTMCSSKPLGRYDGPILAPDYKQQMKDSVVVSKIPAGLSVVAEFVAVQHLLKFEGKFLEVGEAY